MKYNINKQDSFCVFKLEEEVLNTLNAPRIKSELIFLSQEGVKNLILDISAVKFIDSSGLSAILTGSRIWKEGSSFVLCGPLQPGVRKLIEISKLDSILTVIPSQSESIDYVMMEEVERSLLDESNDATIS
jgi:anti-sigma B factor antagonist